MAEVIRMPKMSDTMEEGTIASWLKKEGDYVESGDILAEVETDKATMELESFEDGTLLHIGVKEKESVPVDGVIAIIGEKGEDIQDLLKDLESGGNNGEKQEETATESSGDGQSAAKEQQETAPDASDVNATVITMPKLSDTMEEGKIASWLKKEGDEVQSGDVLAEVETDKATMELESIEDGTILHIAVGEGESVPINGVIAVIGEKGADYEKLLKAHQSQQKGEEEKAETTSSSGATESSAGTPQTPTKQETTKEATKQESASTSQNGRIKASPLAKSLAKEKGYDLSKIPGTGDGGRIIKRDVENYVPKEEAPAQEPVKEGEKAPEFKLPEVVGEESYEDVPLSQMRKTIAKRLSQSKFTAPHFYLTIEINMDRVMDARKRINEYSPVKVSFNDIIIKATAAALRQHPEVNVSWLDDKIRYKKHIHIGVAVAVEEGLLVPVVRFADNKSISHIAAEVKDLGNKAKNKQLQPQEWEGSTFSISNLGMFGIEEFTAIINPPNACILAVGGIKETAVVKDGQLVPGNVMKVTLSCDHRAVDGAMGASFLNTLKGFIEDPVRLLV